MLLKSGSIFFILQLCLVSVFSEDTLVTLPDGQINGRVAKTFQNTTYYAFQEVPYAAPPVGDLRFMQPAPVENWEGVLETTKNTKICIQDGGANKMQNEDCLYLNVYTPVVPGSEEKLPVLFFIHGGKFMAGDGVYDAYGADFFMDTQRIVVVTINYRLNAFGFLTDEDVVIPGNMGLWDQRAALLWVQKNINLFGGDSSKVTIVGQSAGSASVAFHVISKQSKGLFRAAICESGNILTPWSYQRYARDIAFDVAAVIDSTFNKANGSEALLELLQGVTGMELRDAFSKVAVPTKHINPGFKFTPVVDRGPEAFLPVTPFEYLERGEIDEVPMIIGMNSEEAIDQASNLASLKKTMTSYDNDLSLIVNDDLHVEDEAAQLEIGEKIRSIYTDGLFQDDLASSVRFVSDSRYAMNIIKYAQMISNLTDVYFYQFSHDGELGGSDAHIDGAEGVGHSEELHYLWRTTNNDDISKFPEEDILTHKRLVKLWTNFVTDLNPTFEEDELLQKVTWPLMSPDNLQYLDIREDLEVKKNPKGEVFQEWEAIFSKYAVPPFDTY